MTEQEALRKSRVIYWTLSLLTGLLFLVLAFLTGNYRPTELIGGFIWVTFLMLIVTMPVVIPYYKSKVK
ncbi:hypothetical protein [Carboxydothermus ferrireducens]|uniref:Uncharacterized protein n=1 Tax=Carboxydothermus ferrireducens DSM 11255 TaxID=1119529 RepID=A0ABX2R9Q2_9THEO|nr:hypothetical protein [Carboxydothermus ferrireducens]NYE56846.1 hypothetical protein [Carboxydothermus ferrireducens DSM 11255]